MNDPIRGEDARACIKCGRQVGPQETLCAICNRAGMATPSATQYHGTIVVAIVLAVAGLAFAASASLDGVGPYTAEVRGVATAGVGYEIAYAVTNEGTKPGRAKCQLAALSDTGRPLRTVNIVTAQIAGGAITEETASIPGLEQEPADVRMRCS